MLYQHSSIYCNSNYVICAYYINIIINAIQNINKNITNMNINTHPFEIKYRKRWSNPNTQFHIKLIFKFISISFNVF